MSYTPAMPTNNDDIIDSRDVIYWVNALESIAVIDREPEDQDNLDKLYDLQDDAEHVEGWEHGETLIRDTFFQDHAEELAYDIGVIDREAYWLTRHIDWEEVARELQADYTAVKFDGETYWIRN